MYIQLDVENWQISSKSVPSVMVGPILSAKNKGPLNENVIKRFYFVYLKVRNYFYVIKTLAPYRPKH